MSDLIRRYDIVMFENDWMRKESPTGDYVRYEDHAIEIERQTNRIEGLEFELILMGTTIENALEFVGLKGVESNE